MYSKLLLVLPGLVAVMSALPAQASSMPRADFGSRPTIGLAVGNGLSVGLDIPVSQAVSIGGSFSAGLAWSRSTNVDLRLLYKLVSADRGRFQLDLLAGAQGYGPGTFTFTTFEPIVGIATAYDLTPQLSLRGNLATGLVARGGTGPSGIELGYRFSPTIEGTIGANGRGDVIGLKIGI